MKSSKKIINFEKLSPFTKELKKDGNKIVQCHGTFDLVHPGHIIHFEEAKARGDILVVTITAEKFVNKGPGRPFFGDDLRIRSLINLETVDFVSVIPFPAAVEAIKAVCPDVYCKGKEYQNPSVDVTGNIHEDIKTVKEVGGEIAYLGSVVFSSSKLLNKHFETFSKSTKDLLHRVSKEFSPSELSKLVDDFSSLRVLVIGDLILDKYSTVSVQGLTSKNRILSSRFVSENLQAGGALAIFRHIREFTPNVRLFSLAGNEPWIDQFLKEHLSEEENWIQQEPGFTTIVKHRFVEALSAGKELSKLILGQPYRQRPPQSFHPK